jgi:hypothetical protein
VQGICLPFISKEILETLSKGKAHIPILIATLDCMLPKNVLSSGPSLWIEFAFLKKVFCILQKIPHRLFIAAI